MYNINSSINTSTLQASPALDMEIGDQLKRHQKEEKETHIAASNIPFTLNSVNELIYKIYVPLGDLRDQLVKTKNEPKQDRVALDNAISVIDKIHQLLIFDIPASLDKARK